MILLLTAKLVKRKLTFLRLAISVCVATFIIPLLLYFPTTFVNTLYFKAVYSILIVFVTFGRTTKMQFLKYTSMFYFISFSIGGGLLASQSMITTNIVSVHKMSFGLLILLFPVVWYFTKSQMDNHVMDKINFEQLYDVTICLNGQSLTTTALIDSGNELVDPLTNRAVIICEASFLAGFFSEEEWKNIMHHVLEENNELANQQKRPALYIIPFQTVGAPSNYLYALKPEKISIMYKGEMLETKKLFIGIQMEKLSSDTSYHCLLHPKIIQQAVSMAA